MEELLSPDRLRAIWDTVYGWLLSNVFVLGNAVQAGLVVLTLLLAVLIAKRLNPWLARYREHRHVGRGVVIAESLAMSVIWLALLWLAMTVARARRATERVAANGRHAAGRLGRDPPRLAVRAPSRVGPS